MDPDDGSASVPAASSAKRARRARVPKNKTPRPKARGVKKTGKKKRPAYFANRCFAACAFAREAAFLCTTPDFTALSIAET